MIHAICKIRAIIKKPLIFNSVKTGRRRHEKALKNRNLRSFIVRKKADSKRNKIEKMAGAIVEMRRKAERLLKSISLISKRAG